MSISDKPLCSVCIANYNGEDYLVDCIESVYAQDFEHLFEIIIHDDASSDDSINLIKNNYPEIVLITSDYNVGFCISNNRMVRQAKGVHILLLNNDAVLMRDALATLYRGTTTYGDGIYGLPQYNAETNELIDLGSLFDPFLNPLPNLDKTQENVGMIIGACMWLPKSLWDELGGFPDWFESLAEDMYLCCLTRLRGFPVKCLSASGFNHYVGKNLGGGKVLASNKLSTTFKRRSLSERNKSFVMIITYPSCSVWFMVSIHFIFLLLEGFLLSIVKADSRIWNSIYWYCLKEIWKKRSLLKKTRNDVQKQRTINCKSFFSSFTIVPHKFRMLLKYGIPTVGE